MMKEYETLAKYYSQREELERIWKVKAKVVLVVVEALCAVVPKVGE